MKQVFYAVVAILGMGLNLLLLSGCGSEKQAPTAVSTKQPQWILQLPETDAKYYYFRGLATEVDKPEIAQQLARQMAMEQCFEFIQVKGRTRYVSELNEAGRTIKDQFIAESGDMTIKNIKEIASFSEVLSKTSTKPKYNYYILLGLPVSEVKRIKKEKKDKLSAVLNISESAQRQWLLGNAFDALKQIKKAQQKLEKVDASTSIIRKGLMLTSVALKAELAEQRQNYQKIEDACVVIMKDLEGLDTTGFKQVLVEKLSTQQVSVIAESRENMRYLQVLANLKVIKIGKFNANISRYACVGKVEGLIQQDQQLNKVFSLPLSQVQVLASNEVSAAKQLQEQVARLMADQIAASLEKSSND
eukprot:COSAG01_NODE_814_length_13398_cov_4.254230_8_plen_360_part_00